MNQNAKTAIAFGVALLGFLLSIIAQEVLPAPIPPEGAAKPNLASAMYGTILNNPASLFIIILLCVVAWLLDEIPQKYVDSRFVTHITAIIGASTYWLFCFPSEVPKNFPYPGPVMCCIGLVCGFVAGVIHKQAVARLIEFVRGRIPGVEPKQANHPIEDPKP